MASDRPEPAPWSFLWGKRWHRRHRASLPVGIAWRTGRAVGETVNLSPGGALIRVAQERLVPAESGRETTPLRVLQEMLADPLAVEFLGRQVEVPATVIRVTWSPDVPGSYFVGCRFERALPRRDVRRLGLPPVAGGPEVGVHIVPGDLMPLGPSARSPLGLRVHDPADGSLVYAGPLRGVQGRALAGALAGVDPTEVAARLGGQAFTVRLTKDETGDAVLWSESAYLLGVRDVGSGAAGVEIVALADRPPSAGVRRRLVRRRHAPAVA